MIRPCSRPASKLRWPVEGKEQAMSEKLNTAITVIGVDIGKNSFHVVGLDKRGAIVLRQK
jgi:transposase